MPRFEEAVIEAPVKKCRAPFVPRATVAGFALAEWTVDMAMSPLRDIHISGQMPFSKDAYAALSVARFGSGVVPITLTMRDYALSFDAFVELSIDQATIGVSAAAAGPVTPVWGTKARREIPA